jgi:hypothetical protein
MSLLSVACRSSDSHDAGKLQRKEILTKNHYKMFEYFSFTFPLCFWKHVSDYLGYECDHVNGTACIRHQWRKTAVLSCHIFIISSGVKKGTTFKYGLEL